MYYEINVSLLGTHFFATAPRSITSKSKLERVFATFEESFPASAGYEISVTRYQEEGRSIDIASLRPRVLGWHLAVHLDDDTAFIHGSSIQEWDNVLTDAREIFNTTYEDMYDRPTLNVEKIDVYAEMSDGENVHRFTWNNKGEVV